MLVAPSFELPARQLRRRQQAKEILDACFGGGRGRAMVEWQDDPVGWAAEVLEVPEHTLRWSLNPGYERHAWDGTEDPISGMLEAVARGELVGVQAGTGTGKSFALAVVTLWYLAVFEDSRVFSYAPKEDQLRLFMWAEIADLWPKFQKHFPRAELTDLRIRMRGTDKWGAWGYAVAIRAGESSATSAQGAHAQRLLLIVEEGPGVPSPIYTALENTRTGELNQQIVVGNPDSQDDELNLWCERDDVTAIRASGLDFPNVVSGYELIPGAVSRRAVESRRAKYRNIPAMFDSRVRGIPPARAVGVALMFDRERNLETFTPAMAKEAVRQHWTWYAGIDFGAWRFSWILGAVDRAGRLHIVDEVFSGFGVTLRERAELIDGSLKAWGVPSKRLTMVGDSANQTDINEINRAFKKMDVPWRVGSVRKVSGSTVKGYRATMVEKLNVLLANGELLFRRGLMAGESWRLGASSVDDGTEMSGSRLLWEVRKWAYPEPTRTGQEQKEDPDDASADGADAVAALRYLVTPWLRPGKKEKRKRRPNPNADTSLEKLQRELAKAHGGGV